MRTFTLDWPSSAWRGLFVLGALAATSMAWAATPPAADRVVQQSRESFSDADRFWSEQFVKLGARYREPDLIFFNLQLASGCNQQAVLVGPFYCPSTQTVYLDQAFLQSVAARASAMPELALRYVIGHEVSHHVQMLFGTTAAVEQARSRSTAQLSARTWTAEELQADCYTGVWIHSSAQHGTFDRPADVSFALEAVAAIGQSRAAHLASNQVLMDSFTYGSAEQRAKWFRRGLDGGRVADCDTFAAESAGTL